jgi:Fic family protein
MIHHALEDFLQNFSPKPLTAQERLDRAAQEFPTRKFSRKDYLALFKTISTATASRDLKHAVESGLLQKQGEKAQTAYEFRKS